MPIWESLTRAFFGDEKGGGGVVPGIRADRALLQRFNFHTRPYAARPILDLSDRGLACALPGVGPEFAGGLKWTQRLQVSVAIATKMTLREL